MQVTNYCKTTGYVTKQGYLCWAGAGAVGGVTFKNLLIQTVKLNNSRATWHDMTACSSWYTAGKLK